MLSSGIKSAFFVLLPQRVTQCHFSRNPNFPGTHFTYWLACEMKFAGRKCTLAASISDVAVVYVVVHKNAFDSLMVWPNDTRGKFGIPRVVESTDNITVLVRFKVTHQIQKCMTLHYLVFLTFS